MAKHVPNRRNLDDTETAELDRIMGEYDQAREKAKASLLEAQSAYQAAVIQAANERDDGICRVVDAANWRGTQARVVEYLGMNISYMAIRLRASRARQEQGCGTA